MKIDEILRQVLLTKGSAFFYTPPIYKNSRSYYFKNPWKVITSSKISTLDRSINRFYSNTTNKIRGYCFLEYEAGYSFEKRLHKYSKNSKSKLFTGLLFKEKNITEINSSKIEIHPSEGKFNIKSFSVNTPRRKYFADIRKIKRYISEGDTYQVNYTVEANFMLEGDVAELFKSLIINQSAEYTCIINTGSKVIISLSPELFFHQKGRKITVKPMKGTNSRGANIYEDDKRFYELENSNKDKAENVMIVDLLRNDLGKLCSYDSVKVKKLFHIEKYESLYQMTSTIEGKLKENVNLPAIIRNIFPCGSITGAPKIRTMEIIRELEGRRRGIYTGAIGIVGKNKSTFNVAIRTIELDRNGNGKVGIGSGIVWDSDPGKEYLETLLKSRFLTSPVKEFSIFETIRYEKGNLCDIEEHLDRLKKAAGYFLFVFNEKKIRSELVNRLDTLPMREKKRVKIELNKIGEIKIIVDRFPSRKKEIKIIVSREKTDSSDPFQYFKTTRRILYNEEYSRYNTEGFFDVIFLNENGHLCEGAISNIFIRRGKSWFTPPLDSGILAGIERRKWLSENVHIVENNLGPDDLLSADEIVLTNSLRGRTNVDKIYLNSKEFREF